MHRLLFFLLFPVFIWSQSYLWPTNASDYLTSSFCEYRSGHYHAGIDIKTWNTEGYRCYAAADGKIVKIRVSPFGYGKVLYLKMNDGRTAVYAHLQRFTKKIEKEIRRLQIEKQKYTITWHPKNLRVKKGEIIAYSGQTGIGVPHLHFEIRDKSGVPLNPLKFYKGKIKDQTAPKLLELLIIPQDENSRINGSFIPKMFPLKLMNNNIYIIKDALFIKGKIGLALRGFDRADGIYNKFSFYNFSLSADEKKLFEAQYDKIGFSTTHQIETAIHYPTKKMTGSVFDKLYIEPFSKLPFYDRGLGSGIIEAGDEEVRFNIEVYDFSGNSSRITGILQPDLLPPADLKIIRRMNDLAFLNVQLPNKLKELEFSTITSQGKRKSVDYFEVLEREITEGAQKLIVKLKLKNTRIKGISCKFKTQDGQSKTIKIPAATDSADVLKYSISNLGKFVVFSGSCLSEDSRVEINAAGQQFNLPVLNRTFNSVLPARQISGDSLRFQIFNSDSLAADSVIFYHTLFPAQQQSIVLFDSSCIIKSQTGSVYDTLLFHVKRVPAELAVFPVDIGNTAEQTAPDLIQSDLYRINSAAAPLQKSMQLSIRYDSLSYLPEQTGIYKLNGGGSVSYAGGKIDTVNNYITTRISSLADYFLMADTAAPYLEILKPENGQRLTSLDKIIFEAEDSLSGIGRKKNFLITLEAIRI